MDTAKLYYENAFLQDFTATVESCEAVKGGFAVTLDRTAFYPEGGGQPADHGTLGDARVLDVHEKNGVVTHLCDRALSVGAAVDGRIDWTRGAQAVVNLVRGVAPWPGAWTEFGDGVLKIWKAGPARGEGTPGEVLSGDAKGGLIVACGEGAVRVEELQAPGAKRMQAEAYLRGKPIEKGVILGKGTEENG